jgi:hypothetical protein
MLLGIFILFSWLASFYMLIVFFAFVWSTCSGESTGYTELAVESMGFRVNERSF